ncbi:hypothetical protein Q5752_004566 [Cryptotrichosporon argae]
MADHQAILEEEFEVLESIFPDELEKTSETQVRIRIEPDEQSSSHPLTLVLVVDYPPAYPEVIPDLALEEIDEELGELHEGEVDVILAQLRETAEESLGMAMTFTIATAAREALAAVVRTRLVREQEADDARARQYEEEEARKTRGTPLTTERYLAWRAAFRAEIKRRREKEEEDRVRALPPKEREDYRKRRDRPSGKQLFETSKVLANSDEALYDDDATEVDMAQYTREAREAERRREEEEDEQRREGIVVDSDDE